MRSSFLATATIVFHVLALVPSARADAPVAAPAPRRVPALLVHIDSPTPVHLERRTNEDYEWTDICTSPCDRLVPVDDEYRLVGEGVRPSSVFAIEGEQGSRVVLDVNPGSRAWLGAGIAGTAVGVSSFVLGIFVGFAAFVASLCGLNGSGRDCGHTADDLFTASGVMLLGGIALTVSGIFVIAANRRTTLEQSESREAREPLATPSARANASEPIWREPPPVKLASPRAVPLLTLSF